MEILLLEELAFDALAWLASRHIVNYRPDLVGDEAKLHAALGAVHAVVVPPKVKVNRALLEAAPQLRAVGRIHDGTENIDFDACQLRDVRVIQASTATVRANAEYLLSTLLTLYRQGVAAPDAAALPVRRHRRRELHDSVIALLGLSPPAHLLAAMLAPLGARLIGYDPAVHHTASLWRRLGVQPMLLEELLATADAVSLQVTYAPRHRGWLNEHLLAHCKPGQLWTSISRPSMFDLSALGKALHSGRIAAFMMDTDEPMLFSPECALRSAQNLRITPRIGPYTEEAVLSGS